MVSLFGCPHYQSRGNQQELSLFIIPFVSEPQHESSKLRAGETKFDFTGRRPARKSHLVQNAAHAFGFFVPCALASVNAWMPCNRYCNQAVMELCNSMHLVGKILEIVAYFRRIEG
jgi:hypothetical protein